MKKLSALLLTALVASAIMSHAQDTTPLRLVQTIPLPNVEGRIDHLAVDLKGQRLFVAALGNNTMEVLDLRTGTRTHTINGLHEPQGIASLPEFNTMVVANGGDGTYQMFDGESFRLLSSVKLTADADNIRYDAVTKRVYVGYGDGALGILDAEHGTRLGDIKLAGHPESFQLEKSGQRIYVNVPTAGQIAVIDRNTRVVIATWPLTGVRANFPMALDETHHRLLVGARQPARVVVLDTQSGHTVTTLTCAEDTDDLFYDAMRKRVYVSCGEGFVNVFEQHDADHYQDIAKVTTAPGARTSLWMPELNRLFVAAPHRGDQHAAILVYEVR